jgi:cyclophilin family peptidyl-prolyl cis-trans isomerase
VGRQPEEEVIALLLAAGTLDVRLEAPKGAVLERGTCVRIEVTNTGPETAGVPLPVNWAAALEIAPSGSDDWRPLAQSETSMVSIEPGEIRGREVRLAGVISWGAEDVGFRRLRANVAGVRSDPREVYIMHDLVAVIEIEEHGTISLEFWPEVAPRHVDNFIELARNGFYDGLTFHRIIPGFMMQGGCPRGDGTGSRPDGRRIPAEFSDRPHDRGVLSMARSADPNSASSQFFICFRRAAHLDGQYSAFGKVIAGDEVLTSVERLGTQSGRPTSVVRMRRVRILTRQQWAAEYGEEGR